MSEQIIQKDLPCIHGAEIHAICLVRKELQKDSKTDLKKWIKPKGNMFEQAEEIIDLATEAFSSKFKTLSDFCNSCPFRDIYIMKHT